MKTSNKLLLAFFVFMPLLLVAVDLMLKEQFVKGNATRQDVGREPLVAVPLQPFRHVVFDGRIMYEHHNGKRELGSRQRLVVKGDPGHAPGLEVHPSRKNLVQCEYRGDTLLISYLAKTLENNSYYVSWYDLVTLYAPETASITSLAGSVTIKAFSRPAPLELFIREGSEMEARNLQLPFLSVRVKQTAKLDMSDARLDSLAYDMEGGSELRIRRPYDIPVLRPGRVDAGSLITVSGSGPDMAGVLPASLGIKKPNDVKQ